MRNAGEILTAVAMSVLMASSAVAEGIGQPFWNPTAAQVGRVEAIAKPPPHVKALSKYQRHYAGATMAGRKVIEGRWVKVGWSNPPTVGTATVIPYATLPDIVDGRCSVVTVVYEVSTDKIAMIECNGPT